ncbi:hypothetical protein ASPZODRAFT_22254 [Penicilliopsis zonata CBS 506.65]|uniref:FAD-binding FR-type domain-containing protein n=1 Tax=Penicilliopsis zonata CBS 506.65 TaxID=1073090 RepID=A0A1L9SXL9_9EURO|nr:hypothetical protein ASPZODRAFT_22254 [Penicilliopsis zonata CBS 506.65]OJJ51831.1 hypothetical protein ASPZODRAFT_22254 [Penicilliopsis zonata CBS 506.65]
MRLLSLLLTLAACASALPMDCGWACLFTVEDIPFTGINSSTVGFYVFACTNPLAVQSIFMCMRYYCTEHEQQVALNAFNDTYCPLYDVKLPSWSIIDNITDAEAEKEWPHIDYDTRAPTETFYTPVWIERSYYKIWYRTESDFDNIEVNSDNYGYGILGFWGAVLFFGIVNNLCRYLRRHHRLPRAFTLFHRYLVVPPVLRSRSTVPVIHSEIPPLMQTLMIIIFVCLNLILCFVTYDAFSQDLFWHSKADQLMRYIGWRTGAICTLNIPFLWLFGIRNNLLIWMTGWDFATFNQFHRWIARVITLEALVHTVIFIVFEYRAGGRVYFMTEFWQYIDIYMGTVATLCMMFLCALAVSSFRRAVYDVFVLIHKALAIVFLAGLYYHLFYDGPAYLNYMWPAVAFWVFDRVLRYGRLAYWSIGAPRAFAEYHRDADVIQVTVPVRQSISPQPGTYFFLYSAHSLQVWESHPFTLAGWRRASSPGGTASGRDELIFLFQVRKGFTSRLRKTLCNRTDGDGNGACKVRVNVEGVYGTPYSSGHCARQLFVVGGMGVTVATAYLQRFAEAIQQNKSSVREIHIIWALRNYALFQYIQETCLTLWEQVPVADRVHLSMDVYLTGDADVPNTPKEVTSEKIFTPAVVPMESDNDQPPSTPPSQASPWTIQFYNGRPDLTAAVVSHARSFSSEETKSLAIIGCGPRSMTHSTRVAISMAMESDLEVDYYLAPFDW